MLKGHNDEISYLNYFTLSHYMSTSCLNAMKKYDFLEINKLMTS